MQLYSFVTGIEFREGSFLINERCAHRVEKGMTFVVALGLQNFPNKEAKENDKKAVSIFISDTVLVSEVIFRGLIIENIFFNNLFIVFIRVKPYWNPKKILQFKI